MSNNKEGIATQILNAKTAKKVVDLVTEARGYRFISQKTLNRIDRNATRRYKELMLKAD